MTTNTDNNVPLIGREEPSELMHYTNASGLKGILESQSLWATNALFLNDSEEIKLFLDERLPSLVKRASIEGNLSGKIDENNVNSTLRNLMLNDAPPYILSMCSPVDNRTQQNGLLSQWRGYGRDGGYTLVFDREKLFDRFRNEEQTFQYLSIDSGYVRYYDKNLPALNFLQTDNFLELENKFIHEWINLVEKGPDIERQSIIYRSLTLLSCLYKHIGFQEEQEFRVFAIPTNLKNRSMLEADEGIPEAQAVIRRNELSSKAGKKHKIFLRDGCPVPYIELLEQPLDIQKRINLPIKRIIVGPNSNKLQRKKAVELMLSELGINAEIVVSDIPYIGS